MSFQETESIWKNGRLVPWADASLHVMSHVVHYGSAVFEGIRCYSTPDGPAIFRLHEHVRRLLDSATVYRMRPPHDAAELARACAELVQGNRLDECYIRAIALRGYGAVGVHPGASPVDTYIAAWEWGAYLGAGALEKGVDTCVSSWHRPAPNTLPVLAKAAGNYLSSQLVKMEAVANGFDEGIVLGPGGLVSEGSGQNLFLVRDGELITPAIDGTQLQGITADAVLTLAADLGIPTRSQAVPRESLYTADELFFTGTAAEVTPIRSVDRVTIGDGRAGRITRLLQQRLLGIARGTLPDTHDWLTPVASLAGTSATPAREAVA